jgi:membrane dipeptidase
MFLFDAHLDLSMNALEWNRDLTQSLTDIRKREENQSDKPDRGKGVISFAEMRKGNIGLCVATQIARYVSLENHLPGWHSQAQAYAQTQGQLAWYQAMEAAGEMVQIKDLLSLNQHLDLWQKTSITSSLPIGYILSLEGADSIINLDYLHKSYEKGLRAIGPAHYGQGVYAFGTDSEGGLGQKGRDLLTEMEKLNIILDATHLCDMSFWEAMKHFNGAIWASHNLTRKITPHNRQFSDEMIRELIDRQAVIGMAFDAWMIVPDWIRGKSTPQTMGVTIEKVLDHLDHICQIAGNTKHVGIGSDLDGGFGKEQCPQDIESIADLQKIPDLLRKRGFSEADIDGIMWRNWIVFLERVWG